MENRENSGIIFKNSYKTEDKHPDYKGTCVVNGKDMEIALWVKDGESGKFFSAKFSEPYVKPEPSAKDMGDDTDSDDLPF